MAKKIGKLLLFSAAIGSAIGAVCYFARKRNAEHDSAEEDYDDFSEEEAKDDDSRSYVPLAPEGQTEEPAQAAGPEEPACTDSAEECPDKKEEAAGQDGFTPLAEQVTETAQKAEETVEEFFDEDSTDEEPPITDN